MNIEKDIHPSIIAAMNGQQYETETTEVTTDDGDTLEVERFTFGVATSSSRLKRR